MVARGQEDCKRASRGSLATIRTRLGGNEKVEVWRLLIGREITSYAGYQQTEDDKRD
jgi:hypothetical protein